MKLALNGALTIGTLDGANIDIRELVGDENFFLFGMTAEEVAGAPGGRLHAARLSTPRDPELSEALDQIASGYFCRRRRLALPPDRRQPARATTRSWCWPTSAPTSTPRTPSSSAYRDADRWTRMSILNVARCGYFSSDRAIREYCDEIWQVGPIEIAVRAEHEGEATARLGRPGEAEAASLPAHPGGASTLRDLPLLVGLDVIHATRRAPTALGTAQGTLIALATAVAAPTATARFLIRGPLVQSLVCSEIETIERSERARRDVSASSTT